MSPFYWAYNLTRARQNEESHFAKTTRSCWIKIIFFSGKNCRLFYRPKLKQPSLSSFFCFPWRNSPTWSPGRLIVEVCRSLTLRHTTLGRTPLDEWSARLRDNIRHSQQTDTQNLGGIRIRNPRMRAAADPSLTPPGLPYQLHISLHFRHSVAYC